jgi:hypothetical protein
MYEIKRTQKSCPTMSWLPASSPATTSLMALMLTGPKRLEGTLNLNALEDEDEATALACERTIRFAQDSQLVAKIPPQAMTAATFKTTTTMKTATAATVTIVGTGTV